MRELVWVQSRMFGGRGRFSGSQARLASIAAHHACIAGAREEPGGKALVLGCGIEVLEAPALEAPEHPFTRARLGVVEPIEASHAPTALQFAAHANKLRLLCFNKELDQEPSEEVLRDFWAAAEANANGRIRFEEYLDVVLGRGWSVEGEPGVPWPCFRIEATQS